MSLWNILNYLTYVYTFHFCFPGTWSNLLLRIIICFFLLYILLFTPLYPIYSYLLLRKYSIALISPYTVLQFFCVHSNNLLYSLYTDISICHNLGANSLRSCYASESTLSIIIFVVVDILTHWENCIKVVEKSLKNVWKL